MDLSTLDGKRELGARIQRAVMEAGYESLPAFAAAMGWSRALIYQYVRGTVLAQLDRLQQVALATGKPLAWFVDADYDVAAKREAELQAEVSRLQAACARTSEELAAAAQELAEAQKAVTRCRLDAARAKCLATRQGYRAEWLLTAAQEWAALAEAAGDSSQLAAAQVQAGHAWLELGHPAEAMDLLEQACATAERSGDGRLLASAQQELVRALQALGDTRTAIAVAERVARATEWWPRWSGLVACAALLEQQGEYQAAEEKLDAAERVIDSPEAREGYRSLARVYVATNRLNLSLGRGNYEEALRMAEDARALARQAEASDQEREILLSEGLARLRLGQVAAAEACLQQASQWAEWAQDGRVEVLAAVFRAELRARTGRPTLAKKLAAEALSLALERRHRVPAAWAAYALGLAHLAAAQAEDAVQRLQTAAQWADEVGAYRLGLEARLALSRVSVQLGYGQKPAEAAQALMDLAALARQHEMKDLQVEAQVWAACALAVENGAAGEALKPAQDASGAASATDAWWVKLAALAVASLAMAHTDMAQARELASRAGRDAARAAKEIGMRASSVWGWPDLWPAALVRSASTTGKTAHKPGRPGRRRGEAS